MRSAYITSTFLLIIVSKVFPQKPSIDPSVYDKWPSLTIENPTVCSNGKYIAYSIQNQPAGTQKKIFAAINGSWTKEIYGQIYPEFTTDNKLALYLKDDSLVIIKLGTPQVETIIGIKSFKLTSNIKHQKLLYHYKGSEQQLIVRDLFTGTEKIFPHIEEYQVSANGKMLIVTEAAVRQKKSCKAINLIKLDALQSKVIWCGVRASSFLFNKAATEVAFLGCDSSHHQLEERIWLYKDDQKNAIPIADDRMSGIDRKLNIQSINNFVANDGNLLITLKENDTIKKSNANAVKVDIWSYKDDKLQSEQLIEGNQANEYAALFIKSESRVVQLQNKNESFDWTGGETGLVTQRQGNAGDGELNWNPAAFKTYFLVSLVDGQRTLVKKNTLLSLSISPNNRFLTYYDPDLKNYMAIDIHSKLLHNITQLANTKWIENDMTGPPIGLSEFAGWSPNDKFVYVYDIYDLWKIDPLGIRVPENLTHGQGKRDSVVFRLLGNSKISDIDHKDIILSAFNVKTKENGFYSIALNGKNVPTKLSMGNYIYYIPTVGSGFIPEKAPNANLWIVRRMSSKESPNYFYTKDFKRFIQITNINPETKFNWLTSELHSWKLPNGKTNHGILYKPEDFDSTKTYPIIFYYYQQLSHQLNKYVVPESSEKLNVSIYASNGYLVFVPDIHYVAGHPGESALNSVLSAARYLSSKRYVNMKKMGLQGMSWGGFQTNYIVTHSNIFCAACSGSGQTDMISFYGGLLSLYYGGSNQGSMEDGQGRMVLPLPEDPARYIENSPVLFVNNITTPMLLLYNKKDERHFSQGIEFFTALRRMRKKVWMLQYDEGSHGLLGPSAIDFDLRMMQFFNYYLKDASPPEWMTQTRPAFLKEIDEKLDLDTNGIP